MKLDFTPVFLAFGIGLATYLVLRLKKVNSDVRFKDVRFDNIRNEIQLVVENVSEQRLYVKPALRLMRLMPADEWRAKTSGNGSIPMMSASAGSVIKGYDLIGEYAVSVPVEPNSSSIITYPVMRDFGLKAYDNIKVDSPVGASPDRMNGNASGTVRMNLGGLFSDQYADELLEMFTDQLRLGAVEKPASEPQSLPAPAMLQDGCIDHLQITSDDISAAKSEFPIHSLCYCCGKKQWLNWVVGGSHVCDECKDFLGSKTMVGAHSLSPAVMDDDMESASPDLGLELVESQSVDLKPRHKKLLDVLQLENTLSIKELSTKVGREMKAVANDLRYLLRNNLVDRVKIHGKFKYFSLRDSQQVVFNYDEGATEQPECT
jgi:predicted transcriptional regulator